MTFTDIFKVAAAILASLGGGAALVFAFSSWLGKLWASRILAGEKAQYSQDLEALKSRFLIDTERYRTSLKKSEFIFEKEYEAASAFVAIVRAMRPTTTHPDMDWYDACDEIARSFDKSEATLERFFATHGAVLTEQARDLLGRCIATASEGKFHVGSGDDLDPQVNKMAGEFFADLEATERLLVATVRGQSSINHTI